MCTVSARRNARKGSPCANAAAWLGSCPSEAITWRACAKGAEKAQPWTARHVHEPGAATARSGSGAARQGQGFGLAASREGDGGLQGVAAVRRAPTNVKLGRGKTYGYLRMVHWRREAHTGQQGEGLDGTQQHLPAQVEGEQGEAEARRSHVGLVLCRLRWNVDVVDRGRRCGDELGRRRASARSGGVPWAA